jgi:valacyclovir hydrolase
MTEFLYEQARIFYEESGRGDPVLLLPGFAMSSNDFGELIPALVGDGYRVIAADLPGSGRSGPQPRTYTASYYEDDARAYTALLTHLKVNSAHLIGFSDGGEVALLMAALTPKLARSVLVWGAAGAIHDPNGETRAMFANLIDNPGDDLKGFSDYLIEVYGKDTARATTQSFADAMNAIINNGGDISASKVERITCPVLLIAGEHDSFAPAALLAKLARQIPHAETLIVENAGHDVLSERPDWMIATILRHLKYRAGRSE